MALVCSEIDTVIVLSFEVVGRNRAPLHFKTEGVAHTALSAPYFDQLRLDFVELGGYFSVPGTLN